MYAMLQVRTFQYRRDREGNITGVTSKCRHFRVEEIEPMVSRDVTWASPLRRATCNDERVVAAYSPRMMLGPVPEFLIEHDGPNGSYLEPLYAVDMWGDDFQRRLFPCLVPTAQAGESMERKRHHWDGTWVDNMGEPEDYISYVVWAHKSIQRGDSYIYSLNCSNSQSSRKLTTSFLLGHGLRSELS